VLSPRVHVKEWQTVLLITALAAALRFYNLSSLPLGMHGDEAVPGLEARRILHQGWIGPYSPLALGQPSGPLYFVAIAVWFFGNTIFAVRLVPALMGTLAVPALYLLLRRNLDRPTTLLGALLLAVMSWHLHFSRVGFPLAMWPLWVTLSAYLLMEAVRREDWRWWAVAGSGAGLGIYVYNAHHLFLTISGFFVCLHLGRARTVPWNRRLAWLAAFIAAVALLALPMILYAANPANGYFHHFQQFSIFTQPDWIRLDSIIDKIAFLAGRYIKYWDRLCWHPEVDFSDATGVTPLVPPLLLLLSGVGMGSGLILRRGPLIWLGLLMVLLMPLGSVVTVDGLARRTFALAPFLAMFAALGIVEILNVARTWDKKKPSQKRIWRLALRIPGTKSRGVATTELAFTASTRARKPRIIGRGTTLHRVFKGCAWFYAAAAVSGGVCGLVALQNLNDYFHRFAKSNAHLAVFSPELVATSQFMSGLSTSHHVYFYSTRWSGNYETVQFLAPQVSVEDCTKLYEIDPHPKFKMDLSQGFPVFVLMGDYIWRLGEVQRLYPGGKTVIGSTAPVPPFVAYLPPTPQPPAGLPPMPP